MNLEIDEDRWSASKEDSMTGIFVRVKHPSIGWVDADIYALTKNSILDWLHSRGGCNMLAEDVVGVWLGHGNFVHSHGEH